MSLSQPEGGDDNTDDPVIKLPEGLTKEQTDLLSGNRDLPSRVKQLSQSKPEKTEVCTQSDIEESVTFTQKDILGLMASFGLLNKWNPDALKVTNVVLNPSGTVVRLVLRGPDVSADPSEGYQELAYILRGNHHEGVYQSNTSNIEHLFLSKDGDVEWASIVAQFENGAWTFTPGSGS